MYIYTFLKIDYHQILLATSSPIKVPVLATLKGKQLICQQSITRKRHRLINSNIKIL